MWIALPFLISICGLAAFPQAQAVEYQCVVDTSSIASMSTRSQNFKKGQFSVLVEDTGRFAFVSRCSFA